MGSFLGGKPRLSEKPSDLPRFANGVVAEA
jgi:hypothetical protein